MKQYLELLQDVLENGVQKGDRTGVGTRSVFGRQMRFDLSEGFPLVTTKKIHFKSVVHETLWMVSGQTNVQYLKDNGVSIWDEWHRPYSDNRELAFIDARVPTDGCEYSGDFSYAGLNLSESVDRKLIGIWVRMMRRCYDKKHHRYKYYGGKGVTVDINWHDPKVFIEEVKLIPHWNYKLSDWNAFQLDKDYYGARQYGIDTSVWLHESENSMYTKAVKPILVAPIGGDSQIFICMASVARALKIPKSTVHRFVRDMPVNSLKGRNSKFSGWTFSELDSSKLVRLSLIEKGDLGPVYGYQWRKWGGQVDQIADVIEQIKENPNSRRLLVTAWNPMDIYDCALPPCHVMFQFGVTEGKLSCMFTMRSNDVFLGNPFNVAGYALLTHMVAQQCDLEVGELVFSGVDVHLYSNHVEQARLQLSREPRPLPKLLLNKAKSIFDYKYEDFKLEGYDPHPAIRGEVAV